MRVDTLNSLGYGMQKEVAASFNRSRAFQTIKQRKYGEGGTENIADAPKANVIDITTYGSKNLLMSGWAMGEERYLKNKKKCNSFSCATGYDKNTKRVQINTKQH